MIQFSRLRLHGFKSFVDKTDLEIGPGLTGIVGPNGCGKSNLVEALRWSMGENSSKRMRGGSGSMEDVIFSGTERRPSRNMAEVTVLIDNSDRSAPAPFNDTDEVEIARKIERDHGSSYRINGKNVRARDVQLFYADIMSGAHSPFLVSQGKVTALIQAKPADRRLVLEEAAGITGLYARRHEAELRLRAADNNLKRLEDLIGGMETRLQELKKQVRQSGKYRNLSAQIRQLEISIACLEWRRAQEKLQEVKSALHDAENLTAEYTATVSQLTRTHNTQSADLPDLRHQDAEISARLQSQKLALQRLEDEQQHLAEQIEQSRASLQTCDADLSHEQQILNENTESAKRLDGEEQDILSTQIVEDDEIKSRERTCEIMQAETDEHEKVFTALSEEIAGDRAHRQSLERQIAADAQRREAVSTRLQSVKSQLAAKKIESAGSEVIEDLRAAIATIDAQAETLRTETATIEKQLVDARQSSESARREFQEQSNRKARLEAEISTLESMLAHAQDGFKPIVDDVQADHGFETALSRALGDTLAASADDAAPAVWTMRDRAAIDLPSLPAGAEALSPHVKAPEVLKLALSLIGFVETEQDGQRLASSLKPGQSLVSRDGAYWRWDGLHMKATAADSHALQLKQKNRLEEIKKQLPGVDKESESARLAVAESEGKVVDLSNSLDEIRGRLKVSESESRGKHILLNETIGAQAERLAELSRLEESLTLAETDLKIFEEALDQNRTNLIDFNDEKLGAKQQKIDVARETLSVARAKLQEALRKYDIGVQEQSRRKARLHAIADERLNLQNRCIRARERIRELEERKATLSARIEELVSRPAGIAKDQESLLGRISEIETERGAVTDRIAAIEAELAETNKALKQAEIQLAEARESRAHASATAAERQNQVNEIAAHIQEQFSTTPEDLNVQASLDPENLPDLDTIKQQKEKAVRDRDVIGPVNLRADQEAEELEQQLTNILTERNDLMEAIAELRTGIQKLNKEARERLLAAFDHVNAHFQEVFVQLFHGGKAHLALIESDDPLEAGLEIFAQPPGKALQSLSLLSGGEQTLTAIALIFAMFMTNPSPICVLDEIDAPLDDANVDRVCSLLEQFAEKGQTRFLIITHHRLTMARMDRLYGVTMSEKGVSQLVSVDLNQQLDFLEAA